MIKGALFTLGILGALVSGGMGALSVMADSMSDNPTAADNDNTWKLCGIGFLVSVAMIGGAFLVP